MYNKYGHKWNMKLMYDYCKEHNYDLPKENQVYTNTKVKYLYVCPKHGDYSQTWGSHLSDCGCPKCGGKIKKSTQQYIEECRAHRYDLPIDKYKDARTPINHICNKCNNIYMQSPDAHLRGQACPLCRNKEQHIKQRKSPKEYDKWLDSNTNIVCLDSYINVMTKLNHKCLKCNKVFKVNPHNVKNGKGCPYCKQSHGEKFIQKYLDEHNIPYISQKRFKDLKDESYLSYDFYLPNQNVLIEYQGLQHFKSISFDSKNYTNLEKQQYHDKLKREYAKNSGYTLLEPAYKLNTQEKINDYLGKYL